MSDTTARVRIHGFDKLDAHEFGEQLGDTVTFEEEELTSDKAGEPATLIAVVWLTAMGIKALAQWLMKERSRGELEARFEVESEDGTRTTRVIKLRHDESKPASADVIKELAAALDVDPSSISKMLADSSG